MSAVAEFGVQKLFEAPGNTLRLGDVYDLYAHFCLVNRIKRIPKTEFRVRLEQLGYLIGRGPGNNIYVANIALQPVPSRQPFTVSVGGRLC